MMMIVGGKREKMGIDVGTGNTGLYLRSRKGETTMNSILTLSVGVRSE